MRFFTFIFITIFGMSAGVSQGMTVAPETESIHLSLFWTPNQAEGNKELTINYRVSTGNVFLGSTIAEGSLVTWFHGTENGVEQLAPFSISADPVANTLEFIMADRVDWHPSTNRGEVTSGLIMLPGKPVAWKLNRGFLSLNTEVTNLDAFSKPEAPSFIDPTFWLLSGMVPIEGEMVAGTSANFSFLLIKETTSTPIPEPSSALLLMLGLTGLNFFGNRSIK